MENVENPKTVVIEMTSQQIGDDSSIMEFSVDGEYHYEGDTIRFSYPEQRLTGQRGTQTNVVKSPDEVTIDRKGYINSRMLFREGETDHFTYKTPYGNMLMGINTKKITKNFDEHGGSLDVYYVIDYEHAVVTRNMFTLKITEWEDTRNVKPDTRRERADKQHSEQSL